MLSTVSAGVVRVPFAPFTGERVYMRKFERGKPLPSDLARWQDTVDAMLEGVASSGPVFLMVDQAVVEAGRLHRRGGLHVDNYWHEGLSMHGGFEVPGRRGRPPSGDVALSKKGADDETGCDDERRDRVRH